MDEAMERLLDYDGRRYWLENGWSVRFRVRRVEPGQERPHGLKYSFTLHDVDGERLLGFDNAHGTGEQDEHDHWHRFRRTDDIRPYEFASTDQLLVDFFEAVKRACDRERVPFVIVDEDVELEDRDEAADTH